MNSDIASDSKSTQDAAEATEQGLGLPDATWDEARLLDYMRQHDRAIGGLERKTLQHEYCFGAAAQMKYEQLGGKWTRWAKDQGYPLETFRRRRLLFVRAGSLEALDKYPGKMEAYYSLGIYRKPSREELDALDVGSPADPGVSGPAEGVVEPAHAAAGAVPPAPTTIAAAAGPADDGKSEEEPRDHCPRETFLRGLEDRYADAAEALPIALPLVSWKLLDHLAAQEETGHGEVIARAVREYWLRNGDTPRIAPQLPATEVAG
jgi:hypothetical protein